MENGCSVTISYYKYARNSPTDQVVARSVDQLWPGAHAPAHRREPELPRPRLPPADPGARSPASWQGESLKEAKDRVGPAALPQGRLRALCVSHIVNRFSMARLYERAGHLTALNGGFRPRADMERPPGR